MSSSTKPKLNLFGIPFGLTGLAGLWTETAVQLQIHPVIPGVFWGIAATTWLVTVIRYLTGTKSLRTVLDDLKDPIIGPFAALPVIILTLVGEHLANDLPQLGKVWVLTTTTISFAFGAWFITHLITNEREIDQLHSGYFLPTIAAGLISGQSLAVVGLPALATAAFGTGILFWMLFGAVTLHRLAFRPQTPLALVPTYAIFSAPPAVAGNAWLAITDAQDAEAFDIVQKVLLGTFLFLVAVQVLLIRTYLEAPFTLGFWALTFTTTASGRYAVHILAELDPPFTALWQWIIALAATSVVALITAASISLVTRARRTGHTRIQAPTADEPDEVAIPR